jgi:hypothetical protein
VPKLKFKQAKSVIDVKNFTFLSFDGSVANILILKNKNEQFFFVCYHFKGINFDIFNSSLTVMN